MSALIHFQLFEDTLSLTHSNLVYKNTDTIKLIENLARKLNIKLDNCLVNGVKKNGDHAIIYTINNNKLTYFNAVLDRKYLTLSINRDNFLTQKPFYTNEENDLTIYQKNNEIRLAIAREIAHKAHYIIAKQYTTECVACNQDTPHNHYEEDITLKTVFEVVKQ